MFSLQQEEFPTTANLESYKLHLGFVQKKKKTVVASSLVLCASITLHFCS